MLKKIAASKKTRKRIDPGAKVITSEEWIAIAKLNRKEKEDQRKKKEGRKMVNEKNTIPSTDTVTNKTGKQESANAEDIGKSFKKICKKIKSEESDDSTMKSETHMDILSSDDSLGVDSLKPEILDYEDLLKPDDIKTGDFLLVKCKGGSRLSTTYQYLATVLQKLPNGYVEVMGFKTCDEEKKSFIKKDNDIFVVSSSDILGKLPVPNVTGTGERYKYVFQKIVNVYEA